MSYNFMIKSNTCTNAGKLSVNQTNDQNNKNTGLAYLTKGQIITGKVISAGEQVTLDFDGVKAAADKSVLGNVKPGDIKNFEVIKADNNEIELKLLDNFSDNNQKIITAVRTKDDDWDSIHAKKEQSSKKADQEAEYQDTKNKLNQVSSTLTENDCSSLEKEGFPIEGFTANGLSEALNRVKTGVSDKETITEQRMEAFDKEALVNRLVKENLPVTEENLNKLSSALRLSGFVSNMDDKTMQNLISTGSDPSVENIYKAYYSGNIQNTDKLSDTAWDQMKSQVEDVIGTAGYEVNEKNLSDARWLIENNLPLTADTFTYKKNLESIGDEDKDDILGRMLEGMKQGINPKDVSLLPENNTKGEQIVADINSISDDAVAQAVRQGDDLTIRRLKTIQEGLTERGNVRAAGDSGNSEPDRKASVTAESAEDTSDNQNQAASDKDSADAANSKALAENDDQYKELKARRQLEEIRLKMTAESAGKLAKQGISVETEDLSRVVEELKKLENEYYRKLLQEADADTSDLSVQTLSETSQSMEQLKMMPCSVLGSTLSLRNTQTITGLLTEGSALAAEYAKAGTAYETLATVPNSEYGDSIKKAFANAGSLLSQLGLDNTEENNRAVRILGYNRMEITGASIDQVKAYDKQVTTLIQNLHPAVTVRMIKEGINPLNMPINELNKTIDNIKEEQGITSEDKYSTYLRNLESQQGITGDERKAYIGIYRLLYNIDKSDGAAIGAVIRSDREVTLENLLTAVQTNKKGSIDSVVNNEFGALQSVAYKGNSIAGQLSSFYSNPDQENSGQSSQNSNRSMENATEDAVEKEKIEYLDRILKQVKDETTPQKLMEAGNSLNQESSLQNQAQAFSSIASSDKGIWEKVKGVPVEKLLEQLQNAQEPQNTDDTGYTEKVQEIRELCKNSEQSIRFLNDYHIPSTSLNIMMANNILGNGEWKLKKLLKQDSENRTHDSEKTLKETDDLTDKLIDKNSMQDAYGQLETDAKDALNKACSGEIIDSRRLAELKSNCQQMTFLRTLADREFYQIPIETAKGITNMNLTILRGTDTSGRVTVDVRSESLGNVKAEFSLKDQALKGYFGSDNKNGLEQIRNNIGEVENAAEASNVTIKQMDFGLQSGDNDNYSYQNPKKETGDNKVSDNTERILYRIAKAVVQTVRAAENSSS